jgi:hypothetical protein
MPEKRAIRYLLVSLTVSPALLLFAEEREGYLIPCGPKRPLLAFSQALYQINMK